MQKISVHGYLITKDGSIRYHQSSKWSDKKGESFTSIANGLYKKNDEINITSTIKNDLIQNFSQPEDKGNNYFVICYDERCEDKEALLETLIDKLDEFEKDRFLNLIALKTDNSSPSSDHFFGSRFIKSTVAPLTSSSFTLQSITDKECNNLYDLIYTVNIPFTGVADVISASLFNSLFSLSAIGSGLFFAGIFVAAVTALSWPLVLSAVGTSLIVTEGLFSNRNNTKEDDYNNNVAGHYEFRGYPEGQTFELG